MKGSPNCLARDSKLFCVVLGDLVLKDVIPSHLDWEGIDTIHSLEESVARQGLASTSGICLWCLVLIWTALRGAAFETGTFLKPNHVDETEMSWEGNFCESTPSGSACWRSVMVTQDSSSEFGMDQIHTSDELRYAMASRGTKNASCLPWSDMTDRKRHEICQKSAGGSWKLSVLHHWPEHGESEGVLAVLHVASCVIRVKLNAISLRMVPVGKPAHDNLKLVNTLLLKMGTNMYKYVQITSSYLRNGTFALARLK